MSLPTLPLMSALLEKASEAAFSLSRKERAALVHALIQSLDEASDEGVETAWDAEINRRLDAVEAGQTTERDAFVALDEIEARLREAR
jgi:putative addiction module component (TIGR02574 family)